jgi:twitching motility two-component system response regulator PilH
MRNKAGRERQAQDALAAAGAGSPAGGKSIVLADNDALVREALGELLREKGYEVHVARDGLEALRLIRKVRPRYVILDIVMPKMDGSRVCSLIRQDPALRHIPVIAFSSLSAQNFRQFPELSADAYVAKGHLSVAFEHILEAIAFVDEDRGEHGRFLGGAFGYDSVQPRQLIDEMLQERRHYANVLRALGDGALELDTHGCIIMANAGACEFLGRTELEIIGEDLVALLPCRVRKSIQDLLSELATLDHPERCRASLKLDALEASAQFSVILDENQCIGILVILDEDASKARSQE